MSDDLEAVYWCRPCQWEGGVTYAKYNALAPDGTPHNLCERHMLMYAHKYRSKVSIEAYHKMLTNAPHTELTKGME